jgi:hypothetical protein
LCFAHLDVGLQAEAAGAADLAKRHITLAAGTLRMDHFMGRVAVLHAKLRGWVLAGTGGATVMIANPYALHRPRRRHFPPLAGSPGWVQVLPLPQANIIEEAVR